jgi:hypothetical protein
VITGLEQNPTLTSDTFKIPSDGAKVRANLSDKPYADTPIAIPASGDPLKPVAENVWQIEGNWDVLVVRQPDGLVVIEAPQSGSYSAKIIDLLATRFPHIPVKAVVSTTDTTYHYAGLRTYVARGIPVYALSANAPLLRSFFARPRPFIPDELSRHPRAAVLHDVAGPITIGTGEDRIELYPIAGNGDARMMMAYLPGKHLLYGSSNDINPAEQRTTFNAFELVRKVDALKLPVVDFIAIHTDKMSWQKFRELTLTRGPIFGSTAPQPDAH